MKQTACSVGCLWAVLSLPVGAQQVPALNTKALETLPPLHLVSPQNAPLDTKEAQGVRLANQWKTHPDRPQRGPDGRVKYLFGATLPTLVCTPLQVCNIELQAGEVVNDVHAGDTARWKITPATLGTGSSATTIIVVKPVDAGLVTNLSVTTDRRLYNIKLASTRKDWIPVLSFDYPDEAERQWAAYRAQQAKPLQHNTLATGQNLAHLDFGFEIGGDSPSWKPIRIYSDGQKTYIQFPSARFNEEAPVLVAKSTPKGWFSLFSKPTEQLLNYRAIGDRYVVDKVLDQASLIVGVGDEQTEVTIQRTEAL